MNSQTSFRTKLLIGGAGLAISATLASMPQTAHAQAFQATPTVVVGTVNIDRNTPNVDTIDVDSATAVIDWVPDEISGTALDFLPTGATGVFQSTLLTDFSVLNRILPSTNGDIAVIDGSIISRVDSGAAFQPGGFVAFYSPTGILVGPNATFDVGGLMLTTLDPDIASFDAFATGGTMTLLGQTGTTAPIFIDAGAQINASPENSFFIVAAAQIGMDGTADINGSTAYIAGEQVDVTLSNGLFDIVVPVGTSVGIGIDHAIRHGGTTTGPSSTGVGDNHMIYGVARAQNDPISLLFRGNLGFQPAASAGIVNGEIIISANFDVEQRVVAEGSITDGLDAEYALPEVALDTQAEIFINNISVTSDILAISTHNVRIDADTASSTFDDNVYVVGRDNARIDTNTLGNTIQIDGDVLVYSDVISGTEPLNPGGLNATAGFAAIFSENGGATTINGEVLVTASAIGRSDGTEFGDVTGGQAQILASGGTINLNGPTVEVIAEVDHEATSNALTGGQFAGGRAEFIVDQNGNLNALGDVLVVANARGANLTGSGADEGTQATGGDAVVGTFTGGGAIDIGGVLDVRANGIAGDGGTALMQGAAGAAGLANIFVTGGGSVNVDGLVNLVAFGEGASLSQSGTGGDGSGGGALVGIDEGGALTLGSNLIATADGQGGVGSVGGNGIGGTAGARVFDGSATITGGVTAQAFGNGGEAGLGFGGDGGEGRGGNAFLIGDGTNLSPGTLTVNSNVQLLSSGFGGRGGQGDGSTINPGRGGDGIGGDQTTANPFDPMNQNGAYILGDGNTGDVNVVGSVLLESSGVGGEGGQAGLGQNGGIGGDGRGGTAVIGLLEVLGSGTAGAGSADFADALVRADGVGGNGGLNGQSPSMNGQAGNGNGGEALVLAQVGAVAFNAAETRADGIGGLGSTGGAGTGGTARLITNSGGDIAGQDFTASARGVGGEGVAGAGGIGQGGDSAIGYQNGDIVLTGDAILDANGEGGNSTTADGGSGIGGQAALTDVPLPGFPGGVGTLNIGGHASVLANGIGGQALSSGFTGGAGSGGSASVQASNGSVVSVDSAQLVAVGQGGTGVSTTGGDGIGGTGRIFADGAGSEITITHTVPSSKNTVFGSSGLITVNGLGGSTTGGSGIGGTGTGGVLEVSASNSAIVGLPLDPANDPETTGFVRLQARGFGGNSSVDGGAGGEAIGGNGLIIADNGTVSIGASLYSVFAQGGLSADTNLDIDGGNATGGSRIIQVLNGGVLTGEFVAGTAGAAGGAGSGNGNGGDATGGSASVSVDQSTLNLVGRSIVSAQAQGGNGADGGSADGGTSIFTSTNNSTVNINANAAGVAELSVGGLNIGGDGIRNGGNASAGDATVLLSETIVNGGNIQLIASARGGSGADGDGGDATAGAATVTLTSAVVGLIGPDNRIDATAQGGNALADGAGGDASDGSSSLTLVDSNLVVGPDGAGDARLAIVNDSFAGTGDQVGDAAGGQSSLVVTNSTIQSGLLTLASGGSAVSGTTVSVAGDAQAGTAEAIVDGASSIEVDDFIFSTVARGSAGSTLQGGLSSLFVGPNGTPQIDANRLTMNSGAFDGDINGAGRFFIDVEAGTIRVDTLSANALGDFVNTNQLESSIVAEGGDLIIDTLLSVRTFDDFIMRTGMGSTIGGLDPLAPTGNFNVTVQGTISLFGDDANFVGISGDAVNLTSRDLDIDTGAVLGANALALESLNTVHTMIVGGAVDGDGYTLTADETVGIEIFNGGSVSITAPELVNSTGDETELILRDLDIFGTLDDSIAEVFIFTPGIARIEGQVIYNDAGPLDSFDLQANERIEIITPGGIAIVDVDGNPTGSLFLSGGDIWAADDATITQLQADPNFAGRNDQLMTAATGSDDPLGYIRAGGVDIFVDNSLLVRNTGTTEEPGGILVGAGDLSIRTDPGSSGSSSGSNEIDVFAYGRKQNANGDFVTGEAFYDLVNFNQTGTGATEYLAGSEFNDCDINSGECANAGGGEEPSGEVTENAPPVNNPAVVEAPVSSSDPIPPAEDESNAEFGVDFPGLVEAPLLTEDPLLEDPVSSGGDSALYSLGGEEEDDDEEGNDNNQGGENAGE